MMDTLAHPPKAYSLLGKKLYVYRQLLENMKKAYRKSSIIWLDWMFPSYFTVVVTIVFFRSSSLILTNLHKLGLCFRLRKQIVCVYHKMLLKSSKKLNFTTNCALHSFATRTWEKLSPTVADFISDDDALLIMVFQYCHWPRSDVEPLTKLQHCCCCWFEHIWV